MNAEFVQWALNKGYGPEDISSPETLETLHERFEAEHSTAGGGQKKPPRVAEMSLSLFEGSTHLTTFVAKGERRVGKGASEKGVLGTLRTQAALWAGQNGYVVSDLKVSVGEVSPFADK